MGVIEDIFVEYVRMRNNGLDTKEALRALRSYVEPLPKMEKEHLAQQLRAWEKERLASGSQPATNPPLPPSPQQYTPPPSSGGYSNIPDPPLPPPASGGIKPLKPTRNPSDYSAFEPPAIPPATQQTDAVGWVECPNCKTKNRADDIFCYSCGHMLERAAGLFDTRTFADATERIYSDDYFGHDSALALTVRDTEIVYELRPQRRNHELVVGRSGGNTAMVPDVDLANANGAQLGVSRLHLAIIYDNEAQALQVYDLGSSNGSYVNGQKLNPREKRILRNGDELRLGRLVMRVRYYHPGEEIKR